MDFSLFYFADDADAARGARYHLLLEGARFADTAGLTAVWTPERHFHRFGGLYPNPSVTSAAIAAVTREVGIRAGSVVAPLHHHVRIAEEWAVVDNLSNGRAGVSLASGWNPVDFALGRSNYRERQRDVEVAVAELRALWRGDAITIEDGHGAPRAVRLYPRPVQPELPLWLTTGGSEKTFELAARLRAGILTHLLGQDIDALATKLENYKKLATQLSGGSFVGHAVVMVHTYLCDRDGEARRMAWDPLCRYLDSSFDLMVQAEPEADRRGIGTITERDRKFLVSRAARRYFESAALLGSVGHGREIVANLRAAQVDEIACLVDFGVPVELALQGLRRVVELRDLSG